MSDTLTIIRPDDWHVHLRDGDALAAVAPHTAAQFARAVVMPNLKPAVTTTAQALAYKQRIQAALPDDSKFEPLMTLYLTDHTPADELLKVRTGDAFDLVAERKRMNTNRDEANHWAVETFEILLKNRKTEPATIRVVERLGVSPSWKISGNSDAFEKKASDEIEFQIPLKPGEERKVVYTATYTW